MEIIIVEIVPNGFHSFAIIQRQIDYECIFNWLAELLKKLARIRCQENLDKLHSLSAPFTNMSQYFSLFYVVNISLTKSQ